MDRVHRLRVLPGQPRAPGPPVPGQYSLRVPYDQHNCANAAGHPLLPARSGHYYFTCRHLPGLLEQENYEKVSEMARNV